MTIALIAHDGKKAEMVQFLLNHKETLDSANLISTGTTGSHIESAGLKVNKLLSGPLGGDAQIAALAAEKKVDVVVFFRDPLVSTHTNQMCKCLCESVMYIIFR